MHFQKVSLVLILLIFLTFSVSAVSGRDVQSDSAQTAYTRALQQRSMHQIINALIMLGNSKNEKSFDLAYLDYSLALKLSERFGLVKFRPGIFFETGMLHTKAGNFNMAVKLFDSARISALRTGDDIIVCNVYNMLGTIYLDIWNPINAKMMFEQAYKHAMEKQLYRQAGVALGNIAQFINDPDSSLNAMKTAVSLIDKAPGRGKEKALIYINIGNRVSNPDSAIFYYQKSMGDEDGNPTANMVMQACNNMAYSYLDKNQPVSANELLQFTAIPIARADSNFDWLASLYDTWSDVKAFQNDYKEALALEKMAMKSRLQAESRKSAAQVRLLLLLLDVREKDILFDEAQLRVANQNENIRSLKLVVFILVALLLLISVVVTGVYQRIKIKTQRKELDLTKRKIDIHDYERKRLAMQLHDLTGPLDQKMSSQIGKLSFPDPLMRDDLLAEWKKISSVIHSISYQLNDRMVEDLSFPELVHNLVKEFRLISALNIECEISPGTIIAPHQQVNMFCIIQELLANAMKHVKTGFVSIKLTMECENLYLVYHDTGSGFDSARQGKQGMGINNIIDRAVLLGGKATLRTSPGKGTSWIVAVPQKS